MKITAQEALRRVLEVKNSRKVKALRNVEVGETDTPQLKRIINSKGTECLYIFKDENTGIISPADDSLPPIYGQFEYDEDIGITPLALWLLLGMAEDIRYMLDNPEVAPTEEDGPEEEGRGPCPSINEKGLLGDILWHLRRPFCFYLTFDNTNTTSVSTEECVAGCPTIAIALVVCYLAKYKGLKRGYFATPKYTSKYYNFSTKKYDPVYEIESVQGMLELPLDKLKESYGKRKDYPLSNYTMKTEADYAAAELCNYIARTNKTSFSPKSSGSHFVDTIPTIENALRLGKGKYFTDKDTSFEECERLIQNSILEKELPVLVAGFVGDDPHKDGGHYFIIDGYKNGWYHFNLGGGPSSNDGWYSLADKTGGTSKFSYRREYWIFENTPTNLVEDVNLDGYINMADVTAIIHAFSKNVVCGLGWRYRYTGLPIRPVSKGTPNNSTHAYIDLKLPSRTLWSQFNIGSESEEDPGLYFSWGETDSSKSKYLWSTYQHGFKDSEGNYKAKNIGKNICNTLYDAAHVLWGDTWRMPLYEDFKELQDNCNFAIEKINDVYCIEVTRKISGRQKFYEQYTGKSYYRKDNEGNLRVTEEALEFFAELINTKLILPLGGHIYVATYYGKGTDVRLWMGETRSAATGYQIDGGSALIAYYNIFAKGLSSDYLYVGREDVNYDGRVNLEDIDVVINRMLNK